MEKKSIIVVLGIIENEQGEVLLSLRNDPKFPGAHLKWDLVGGKNEVGESLEETLTREIEEETGLGVVVEKLLPKSICKNWELPGLFQHTLLFCYVCQATSGELQNREEKIKELRWVKKEELFGMDLLFSAREYLEML
ncbi:MAG: NUDIX domain-containing protein [Parcubacteria group bacterium]